MARGIVAIYGLENEYVERLMEYIEQRNGLPFKLIAFTQREEMTRFLNQGVIHILLSSQECVKDIFDEDNIKMIVLLSQGTVNKEYEKLPTIYKYQSSDNIIRDILKCYLEVAQEENVPTDMKEADIIGVYSPVGNWKKTLMALAIGQIYSSKKRTLYINLEEFSALDNIVGVEFDGNISDLMYYFRQSTNAVNVKLQAIARSVQQLEIIPPITYSQDLRNVGVEWWIKLVQKISMAGIYEVVILDVGNMVEDIFKMLDVCKKVYIPRGENPIETKRVEAFEEYILKSEKEELFEKIRKVEISHVSYDSWCEKSLDEFVWGKEGDFLRDVLNEDEDYGV